MIFPHRRSETIAREISALPHVRVRDIQFNLDNWLVLSLGDSWKITPPRKPTVPKTVHQTGTLADSTIVIEKAEDIKAVLDDIEKGSPKVKNE